MGDSTIKTPRLWQRTLNYLFGQSPDLSTEAKIQRRMNYIILFCSALALFLYQYFDSRLVVVSSVNFWEVIWKGNITDFYAYREARPLDFGDLYTGGVVSILPRAIWNLPNFIAYQFFKIDYSEVPVSLIWGKLYNVVFYAWMLLEITRIAELLSYKKTEIRRLLFLSFGSIWTFINLFYGGMSDAVWIALSLFTIRLLLEEKEKPALVMAAFTVLIKPFFLLAYLVVLFSTERKLSRIFIKTLVSVSFLYLERLILSLTFYRYNEVMRSSGLGSIFLDDVLRFSIKFSDFSISLLFLIYGAVLLYAYFSAKLSLKQDWEKLVFRILLMYSAFLLLTTISFYRPMMLIPWLYFSMVKRPKFYGLALVLDTIIAVLGPLTFILNKEGLFDLIAYRRSAIMPFPNTVRKHSISWSFELFEFLGGTSSLAYVFIGTVIALIFIMWFALLYSRQNRITQLLGQNDNASFPNPWMRDDSKHLSVFACVRTLIIPIWMIFSIVVYFV